MTCKVFVIGDPHLKQTKIQRGNEFIKKVVTTAKELKPTFIVILGDVFDKFESVNVHVIKMVTNMFKLLSKISPVIVLVGNHDYINNSQFLTDNHALLPFAEWENIWIIDQPQQMEFNDKTFVFCPYVPPGRFMDAMKVLVSNDVVWDISDCIFAHQEFKGCHMGRITSKNGDEWHEDYPPVISGHIHDEQHIGNVHYPGSPIQHSFAEKSERYVWCVTFDEDSEMDIEKIDLELPKMLIHRVNVEKLLGMKEQKLLKQINQDCVKIVIKDVEGEIKRFKRSKMYSTLSGYDVELSFDMINDENRDLIVSETDERTNYSSVLKELVKTKDIKIQEEYKAVFG